MVTWQKTVPCEAVHGPVPARKRKLSQTKSMTAKRKALLFSSHPMSWWVWTCLQ
nr:MAG TPA: hypothetical protein [Caudoviricetes sp.]